MEVANVAVMSRTNPTTFDEYQYGTSSSHRGSVGSAGGRSIRFDEHAVGSPSASSALLDHHEERSESDQHGDLRRRRSSIGLRLNSIAQIGGVNSINNFARSWTRAAGFLEVTPHRPSFILHEDQERDEEETLQYGKTPYGHVPRTSLLRAQVEAHGSPEDAVDDESIAPDSDPHDPRPLSQRDSGNERWGLEFGSMQGSARASNIGSVRGNQSIFAIAPHLATPLPGSYGTSYGTLRSSLNESSMIRAGELWRQQQASRDGAGDREPLLVKEVEQDGKVVLVVAGQSTLPQTVFNSTNVMIGVGLLSLPMGLRYSGWICGMIFLLLAAVVTAYTANILAKCMDCDASLITFADLAYVSYGQKARIATSVLFTLELLAACVALIVLFADTLDLLIPGVGVIQWKILCGLLLIPLNFAPLSLLSFSSVIGIFSTFSIVMIVFADGFIKPHTPGSLREPAATYLFPNNWLTLPLSFGLLMSPWGGHSVFPNIYRDMRHPYKFKKAVEITFSFTYFLDCATAVAGILMFGDGVMDEITANIINTSGYPRVLSVIMSVFIAIIPLTKVPLNARPIISTIELFAGLNPGTISDAEPHTGLSAYTRGILKVMIRVVVVIIFVIISIVFPAFDSIMAFMGSTLCFTICVILPLMFYLKIFGKEVPMKERVFCWFLVAVSSVLATIGTIWAFLPKSMIGAE